MNSDEKIRVFLDAGRFGVVGASADRNKYGNKVLRCYQLNGREAIPVNPKEKTVEGLATVPSVAELPDDILSISVITPPVVTETVVTEAIAKGIKNIWMQPGAESQAAVKKCTENGINVIADGSCILVVLGYRGH
jgi:predicted CoA-binding protein